MRSGGDPRIAPSAPVRTAAPVGYLEFVARRTLAEWAIPAALAAFALRSRLVSADLRLEEMPGRTVGIAVLHGVDVAGRTALLFEGAAIVLLTLAAALLGAWWARGRLARRGDEAVIAGLRRALGPAHALAATSLAILILEDGYPALVRAAVLMGAAAVALVIALAVSVPRARGDRAPGRAALPASIAVAIAGWAASHAVAGLAGRWVIPPAAHLASAVVVSLAVVALPWWARKAWGGPAWRARLTAGTLPLVLLPLAPCIAQEIAYAIFLRGGPALPFRSVSLAVAAAFVAAAVALAWRAPRGARPSPGRQLSRRHLPTAVAVLAVVRAWAPAGALRPLDFFHEGEAAVPAHQLVRFGALPYLDVFPTHGLGVSYAGGLLEWLLTGSVTGDGRLAFTEPLLVALGTVATYALVRRTSGSALLAAFVAAVLPAWPVSYVLAYAVGFFGLVALADAAAGAAGASFLRVGLWLLAVTLFRVDAGIMVAAVVLVVAGARVARGWSAPGAPAALRGVVLPAFGPVAAALAVVVGAMLATRPGAGEALGVAREFLSLEFQALAMGNPSVASPAVPRPDSRFVFLLLPAVSLVGAVLLGARRLLGRARWEAPDVLVVALFGYNTLLLTRALGRHTEAEAASLAGFTSSFTILLVLLLALRLGRARPWVRPAALGIAALVVLLVPLPGGSLLGHAGAAVPLAAAERPARMSPWSPRFAQPGPADAALRGLRQLADAKLAPGDRILDLSHEPLLYVALDRAFPGYVVPILYATSERSQALLLRALGPEVRMVVLRDERYWRDVDGVPDALRSYRVYEHVHRRFPWAVRVGSYTVLLPERPDLPAAPVLPVALAAAGEQPRHNLAIAAEPAALRLSALGPDPHVEIPVPAVPLAAGEQLGVEVELAPGAGGPFQVFFGPRGEPFSEPFSVSFHASGAATLRLESPPAARALVVDRIRLDLPEGGDARVARIALRPGSAPVAVGLEERIEHFEVGLLPWLWARSGRPASSDAPADAVARAIPAKLPLSIAPRRTVELSLEGVGVAPDDQVRLRVRADRRGALAVRYGREGVAKAGMSFELVPGTHAYVLRFGPQASWTADRRPVTRLEVESRSDAPVSVEALSLERAD